MASGKLEALILHLITVLKTDVEHYCDLETVDGDTIVANDGSLATVVAFHGVRSLLGHEDFDNMVARLNRSLSTYFKTKGHQLQVVFRRDLDARTLLEANAEQQRATAARLQLDVGDLIDEGVARYAKYIYNEECYFVFWSRPCLLDPTEAQLAQSEINAFRRESHWPRTKNAQNLLRPIRFMYDRHQAYVAKVCADLQTKQFPCSIERMDAVKMLRAIRKSVYPDYTSATWEPSIPGKPVPARWKTNDDAEDASELLYPTLPRQLMVGLAETGHSKSENLPDPTTVRLGRRVYAPLLFEVAPSEPQVFNNLFDALNKAETQEDGQLRALPYSISFMLESDGMSVLAWKTMFTQLLFFSSEVNRNINLTAKALANRQRDGERIVKLRIAAMTWSGAGQAGVKELALRKSKLFQILTGWGKGTVIERTGNPLLALQSNAVGLTWKHIGNPAPAPLGEALAMLPLTRPASPFDTGSCLYRSLDGKLMRYKRFAREQSTLLTLIAGKPGSGKSILLNNNNVEFCILPGLNRLPFQCTIDIGGSSAGSIDLVRDSLPPDLRHQLLYKRLRNHEDDCINPFDTPLGKRQPLPDGKEFVANFVTALITPAERKGAPYENMSTFVSRVIDAAYKFKADKLVRSRPEQYLPNYDPVVDAAIAKLGLRPQPATTYWELVDTFFEAGLHYEAEIAQRRAVPLLETLIECAASDEIASEYKDVQVSNNLPIAEAFRLGVREAIEAFPMFRGVTRFDVGSARVMALDLQDVAGKGSDAATKRNALMYMIARQSFMKKICVSAEDLKFIEPLYLDYYKRLVDQLIDEHKVLCMDEFHRTAGNPQLLEQLDLDAREGRKWSLEIILASQEMKDFGPLIHKATTIFMVDAGLEGSRKTMRETVGLSPVEESALTKHVTGPTVHGTTFLARFLTTAGTVSQLLTLTMGPQRLWALSTTPVDRKLRTLLYAAMPGRDARALLARRFPGGSCAAVVEQLKGAMKLSAGFVDDEEADTSVVEKLARDMIAQYHSSEAAIAA